MVKELRKSLNMLGKCTWMKTLFYPMKVTLDGNRVMWETLFKIGTI